MKVLIDNGHGENTPGKRSPDGRLREWAYTRKIADRVITGLRTKGIDAERIVKEMVDIPLSVRCRRANTIYRESGGNAILVSIHCNAAGFGSDWLPAHGWSVFISDNASTNSKKLAMCLAEVAIQKEVFGPSANAGTTVLDSESCHMPGYELPCNIDGEFLSG